MSSSSSTVNTSDDSDNQLEPRSYTCRECNIVFTIFSPSSSSSPYCPHCSLVSSLSSLTLFEVGHEDEEISQSPISTVEISSSSDDSTLTCAICTEDFVVGESVEILPCDHLYHCDCIIPWLTSHNTCPLCRFELPVADSDDEGCLTLWFDVLELEDD